MPLNKTQTQTHIHKDPYSLSPLGLNTQVPVGIFLFLHRGPTCQNLTLFENIVSLVHFRHLTPVLFGKVFLHLSHIFNFLKIKYTEVDAYFLPFLIPEQEYANFNFFFLFV